MWTVSQGVDDKEKALGEDGEDLSDNEDADDSTKERTLINEGFIFNNLI